MPNKNKIFVTQPFLPPIEEFNEYVKEIWENKWLTNKGPLHERLEKELADYLGVPYISLFANGTVALLTALQALDIEGEVITTPFTFVATPNSLVWNKNTPVFVDVESRYCNLDPHKIEAAITDKTTAIMPVHVYGNPCYYQEIDKIAKKYNLKVIYDAAHAFGVKQAGESVLNYGDLAVLSFHATKVYNTFEGGAIVCHSAEMKKHIDDLKNFGFRGETKVILPGINGKMSEVHAAMGLVQLKYIDGILDQRRAVEKSYIKLLSDVEGIEFIPCSNDVLSNASYLPIFVQESYKLTRDQIYFKLQEHGYMGRRYFYPLVSEFEPYQNENSVSNTPIAKMKSEQVICLPIYPGLENADIEKICDIIRNS